MLLLWILFFCMLGSVLSIGAATAYLLLPQRLRERTIEYLISFAIGMLLGAAFLHLLPEALTQNRHSVEVLMATALAAILIFFMMEKALLWRHHHHGRGHSNAHVAESATDPAGTLILIGDSFHNFLDGVLLTAAFLADFRLGVVTSLAVIAHEIPQELGDFAILLRSGFSRARALWFNLLTSLSMIVGALLAWFALGVMVQLIPYLLTFTAASFVYVAVSDLMPTLNRDIGLARTAGQVGLIAFALGLTFLMHVH